MRIQTELSEYPNPYTVVKEDGKAIITFYTNIEEKQKGDGLVYTAAAWTTEKIWTDDIENRIDANRDIWFEMTKQECYDEAAKEVREKRNAMLAESDKDVAFDRLGIELPENITAINLLTSFINFIRSLKEVMTGNIAKYRQALRDLPEQEGFPFDVIFPMKP